MKTAINIILFFILGVSVLHAEDNTDMKVDTVKYETATFAGGCFWCIQPPFDKLDGVVKTTVGYTGGKEQNPTYKEVSYGKTGHAESIEILYNPEVVSYSKLLEVFWMNIDPTDNNGQFVDRGSQYRPAIFYHNEEQKKLAVISKTEMEESGRFDKPIVVEITAATTFWKAEDYHQQYYKKNPTNYYSYKNGSGRNEFKEKYWGHNN